MALKEITAATTNPVTTAEAKTHMRVDSNADDTLIASLITAATKWCEQYTRRQLVNATWELRLDKFPTSPSIIYVPKPPLSSVVTLKYIDTDGAEQTWDSDEYTDDTYSQPGRVEPAYGYTWPAARAESNAIRLQFVAGYGATGASVPEAIKVAIKMLIAHWHEQREPVVIGTISKPLEFSLHALLGAYCMPEVL